MNELAASFGNKVAELAHVFSSKNNICISNLMTQYA